MSAIEIRPSKAETEKYRSDGLWRDSSQIGDLRHWRDETPEACAFIAYRSDAPARRISYAELASHVERFAGALTELGVGPGDVVALQVPNFWQAGALLLAVARVGAVLAPVMTTIRPRELERVLDQLDACICVTIDAWDGFDHAAALREMAPRLPQLRHRVILGATAEPEEISFASFFEQTAWEKRHPMALEDAEEDPDRVALVLFTSGTSGEPKGAMHTSNTIFAGTRNVADAMDLGPDDTFFGPFSIMHITAEFYFFMSLLVGASTVLLDTWSTGDRGLALLAESNATIFGGAPPIYYDIIAAANGRQAKLPKLRRISCGGTVVLRPLIDAVRAIFGLPLRVGWGMTEIGLVTSTGIDPGDPPDWAAHSDGRPHRGVELQLRSDGEITPERPARVYARGAGVCLATVGRDSGELTVIADHNDGWYDTGDLAIPDGRGGIRLMGRAVDRIGGILMIPVKDVESVLLEHPGVGDAALVGYPDGKGGELACAVISAASTPGVALDELRAFLRDRGMTEWYLPSRAEYIEKLPRNATGKIEKELLRRWLRGEAKIPDAQ